MGCHVDRHMSGRLQGVKGGAAGLTQCNLSRCNEPAASRRVGRSVDSFSVGPCSLLFFRCGLGVSEVAAVWSWRWLQQGCIASRGASVDPLPHLGAHHETALLPGLVLVGRGGAGRLGLVALPVLLHDADRIICR
eukprot:scaffold3180_cov399-Prasinococcus_capsulatus_cf.AAC.9